MLDFSQFEVLTFDCYGTLIDWESGILKALHALLRHRAIVLSDNELLEAYAVAESAAESEEFKPYREVLAQVVDCLGARFGFKPAAEERQALVKSVMTWQPFPDTVPALRKLHRHYKLSIISNIDDDLFAATAKLLEERFDFVTTALEVGSYKPSLNNFHRALQKMNISKDRVLHVAQSRYHDIEPASSMGIHTVWVNRRHERLGAGATVKSYAKADLEVPDLKTLADLALISRQSAVG